MGTKAPQAASTLGHFYENIPTTKAPTRANAQNTHWIVIPVVVGSSPISHPSIHAACSPTACTSIQRKIPIVGILTRDIR